jgi:hypothetical protein
MLGRILGPKLLIRPKKRKLTQENNLFLSFKYTLFHSSREKRYQNFLFFFRAQNSYLNPHS